MHIVCGGKLQYSHYDLNPHYIWEREMQYLHNNLKMHTIYGWQNVILTFLLEFDDLIKTIQGN
jgi:hypothetical protein